MWRFARKVQQGMCVHVCARECARICVCACFRLHVNGLFSQCKIVRQIPNSFQTTLNFPIIYLCLCACLCAHVCVCVCVCSSLMTLHGFHFCFCDMKTGHLVLDASGSQKRCLCLCTFCNLASVAGPPVSMCCGSDKGVVSFPRFRCSFIRRRVASSQGHRDDPACILSLHSYITT